MKLKNCASALALAAALLTAGTAAAQTAPSPAPQAERPNVLIWMLDDVGFAQLSSFGGLIDTPNIERVSQMGLRYTNYHVPPVCSASRAAFLTGRNPHSVHVGSHAGTPRPFPGYDAHIPASAGTIAENLRQTGYVTYALGKWDHLPSDEMTVAGPFNRWPLGQGFDRYYGFLAAETDNWSPILIQDNAPIPTPSTPGYHLNDDLADHAIDMINARGASDPAAPFLMYWATGTAHAPHHAPMDWIARYRGRLDMGWDVARERILQRQISEGVMPASAELAARPDGMPAWDSLSADQRRLYARQMEVFAASLSYADAEFGRILDALQARGELDNTIVIIASDNGASGEGAYSGLHNEHIFINGQLATDAENLPHIDQWGGPETAPHYSFGWAVAGNTPFHYYKMTTHEGGTHVPLIISWPRGIAARGEIRRQFVFGADVAPTIMEAVRAPLAETVSNVRQQPMDGHSFVSSFANANANTSNRAQYVEMYGNRGLWSDGWSIVTSHRLQTWDMSTNTPVNEPWELYNLNTDPGQVHNLATEHPDRVAAMGREFEAQARRYNVNPIGNMGETRALAAQQAQAEFQRRHGIWRYPMPLTHLAPPPITRMSYRMTADLTLTSGRETGPIWALGNDHGGVGLYLRSGRPVFMMTALSGEEVSVEARSALPRGASQIELQVSRATAAPMTPASYQVTISANGRALATQTFNFTLPSSTGEQLDIGRDDGGALTHDYRPGIPFAGQVRNVVFDFTPR